MLAIIGAVMTGAVGWAVQDIYGKLDRATIRLCVVEYRQWQATEDIAGLLHVHLEPLRLPHQCRAKVGKSAVITFGGP